MLPEYQNQKIGSKLLLEAVKTIKQVHPSVEKIIVEIIAEDIKLFNFYLNHGFRVKEISGYGYNDKDSPKSCHLHELNSFVRNTIFDSLVIWAFLELKVVH